jgi:hypothetical protein
MTILLSSHPSLSPRGPLLSLSFLACFSSQAFAANEIKGSVHNQTLNQPASNDDVLLLHLGPGMPEEGRAKTDTHGAFSISVKDPTQSYLLRIIHQGVAYDQRAVSGDTVSLQVFDSSPSVPNVVGTIEILRAGTTGPFLHVSDMYELRNDSNPPVTQASDRTFDVYLPPYAKLSSVLAAGPGKIGERTSATPAPGQPGHFTVNFPLRPGATKFAFNYDLPYSGRATFQTNRAYSVQQLAVMLPLGMKFVSRSAVFVPLATGSATYQVMAANQLASGKGPAFELSGSGDLPALPNQAKSQPATQSQSPAFYNADLASPTTALQTPASSPALPVRTSAVSLGRAPYSSSQSFVLAGLSGIFLATCVFLIWHTRRSRTS